MWASYGEAVQEATSHVYERARLAKDSGKIWATIRWQDAMLVVAALETLVRVMEVRNGNQARSGHGIDAEGERCGSVDEPGDSETAAHVLPDAHPT